MKITAITYEEMRKGCWDPKARLEDMDANWTEAQMCFPSFPRFCGQTFLEADDRDLALLCVKAYNDWMVDEWCGDTNGRLIPLIIIPLWDANLAAEEIVRNAARGVRATCFSEIPPYLGLPSIHSGEWDPFFAACAETGVVVNMHIGSSSKMPSTSADAPPAVGSTLTFGNAMSSMVDFLMSGVLVRYPKLTLAYSEGQIGWIPYILERADKVWEENRGWNGVYGVIPEPPSTLLLPPDLRLLLRRRARPHPGLPREVRARQHHVRDRLPALRQHVAPQPRGRPEAHGPPRRRHHPQAGARQRHPHARPAVRTVTDTDGRPPPAGPDPDASYRLLIGGEWVEGGNGTYDIVNPATEEVVGHAPDASAADAEAAAEAAAAAFPAWSRTTPEERAALLNRAADLLDERYDELVPLVQAETGATLRVTKQMQVPQAGARFRRYAQGIAEELEIPLRPGSCPPPRWPPAASSAAWPVGPRSAWSPPSRRTTSR